MVKPIGNLSINMKSNDKVSSKIRNKFGPQSIKPPAPAAPDAEKPEAESKKIVKYKKRKR